MISFEQEPLISVGLMTGAQSVRIALAGRFHDASGNQLAEGDYLATRSGDKVRLAGASEVESPAITISPADLDSCRITVHDITIGIEFHWERKESQQFQGALKLVAAGDGLAVVNHLPLESYLVSVISSEMSASAPPELLRAHSVVSRSWLLAQLDKSDKVPSPAAGGDGEHEIIKWYGRENHSGFDVCADDHCQRYQGISKAFSGSAFNAVLHTRGKALVYGGELCDTRYSKSCGGMTEAFRAAWEEADVPYLAAVYDGEGEPAGFAMPLTEEANAEAWIAAAPAAYCNTDAAELLGRILPGFDQETRDFYRWEVSYSQAELSEILGSRLGVDFGRIRKLEAVERGESGRIIRLRIEGEARSLVIGKELEIRRALSRSHLYSSAFVVRAEPDAHSDYPSGFRMIGAGWGHGVGLCQIGAAVMAERGRTHEEILSHYFRGARLRALY